MFKVESYGGQGYKISIGTGKTFRAYNLQGVVFALQHYFHESIPMYPYEHHNQIKESPTTTGCPLCKE